MTAILFFWGGGNHVVAGLRWMPSAWSDIFVKYIADKAKHWGIFEGDVVVRISLTSSIQIFLNIILFHENICIFIRPSGWSVYGRAKCWKRTQHCHCQLSFSPKLFYESKKCCSNVHDYKHLKDLQNDF